MGNGITNCYPDEVGKFISITVLTLDEVSAPDHDARMRDGRRVQIPPGEKECYDPITAEGRSW